MAENRGHWTRTSLLARGHAYCTVTPAGRKSLETAGFVNNMSAAQKEPALSTYVES